MTPSAHFTLLRQIDSILGEQTYPETRYTNEQYKNILFRCNKWDLPSTINIDASNIASFWLPNIIVIHRFNYTKPDTSYLDEAISAIHEYGHFLSVKHGTSGGDYASLTGFGIIKNEFYAWKEGLAAINSLPLSALNKIILWFVVIFGVAPYAMYDYIMMNELLSPKT